MNLAAARSNRIPAALQSSQLVLAANANLMRPVLSEALGEAVSEVTVERTLFSRSRPPVIHYRYQSFGDVTPRLLIGELVGGEAQLHQQAVLRQLGKARRAQITNLRVSPLFTAERSGLVFRHLGFDANILGLRLLHDRDFVANMVAKIIRQDVVAGQVKVLLKAHRLGKRAVLLVECTSVSGTLHRIYVRLRPTTHEAGRDAFEKHVSIAQHVQSATTVRVPKALHFEAEWGAAFFDELPGAPPVFTGFEAATKATLIGTALAEWRALAPITGKPWSYDDELSGLNIWATHLSDHLPHILPAFMQAFAKVSSKLAALPVVQPAPCHRDFHEGQLLVNHDTCGILDFDTWCDADPALDVGNFAAHIRLWELRNWSEARAFKTAFTAAASKGQPSDFAKRVEEWKRAALLRLAAMYAFTSEPEHIITQLMDEAAI
jgi:Phosphotransferase enzyme family